MYDRGRPQQRRMFPLSCLRRSPGPGRVLPATPRTTFHASGTARCQPPRTQPACVGRLAARGLAASPGAQACRSSRPPSRSMCSLWRCGAALTQRRRRRTARRLTAAARAQVTTRTEVEEDTWDSDGTWTHSTSAASSTVRQASYALHAVALPRRSMSSGSNHPPTDELTPARATQAQTGRADKSLVIAVTDTVRRAAPPQLPRAARCDTESTEPQASAPRARHGRAPPASVAGRD